MERTKFSLTNEKSRDLAISLSFLDSNATYKAQIYTDAEGTDETHNPKAVAITKKIINTSDSLKFKI